MQQNDGTLMGLSKAEMEEILRDKTPEERTLTPIFSVGELLEIRGGKFRIIALGTGGMLLRGVPWSTTE